MKPQVFFWWLAYAALEPFGLPALAEERPAPPAAPPQRMSEEKIEAGLREWFEGSNQALREARLGGSRRRRQ